MQRKFILKALESRRVGQMIITAIMGIYELIKNIIRTRNMISEDFTKTNGLKQGGNICPLLFIFLMDEAMKKIKNNTKK